MRWLLSIAAVFFAVSCSGNHAGIRRNSPGGIMPSLTPIDRPYKVMGEAETRVSAFNLLWSANVSGAPDFERARRELIQTKGGDDIVQVSWFLEKEYWLLGTINILHLKATVIKFE